MIATQQLSNSLMKIGTAIVQIKGQKRLSIYHRALAEQVYKKQSVKFEKDLSGALEPLFKKQISSAIKELKSKSTIPTSSNKIFNPSDWDKELINVTLPIIAKTMAESAMAQYVIIQDQIKKSRKASTASQWFASLDKPTQQQLADVIFSTAHGDVAMGFMTEYPEWMKTLIQDNLQETFNEPFWAGINQTTGGDIDVLLNEGLQDGWSIDDMADEMETRYGSNLYPKSRGLLIARTEAGNSLNGTRSQVIDNLKAELGDKYPMRKIWLSILGNTTRDDHANLDGVPAADDGCWALDGIRCRWPGDVRLSAKQRCNCQCSIWTSFGMVDEDADELIAEHEVRQSASGKSVIFSSFKCGGRGGTPGPCPSNKPKPESNPKSPLSKLSKTERNAIEDYSTDKFQQINGELRSGKLSPENQKIVKSIDSGLAKAEKRSGATIRSFDIPSGKDGDAIRNMLKPGAEFSDAGYVSTRKVPSLTDKIGFVEKKTQANRVILKVVGKNGVDITEVSLNKQEGEVLYPRGTKFKVSQAEHLPNGAILAIIEEIHNGKAVHFVPWSNIGWFDNVKCGGPGSGVPGPCPQPHAHDSTGKLLQDQIGKVSGIDLSTLTHAALSQTTLNEIHHLENLYIKGDHAAIKNAQPSTFKGQFAQKKLIEKIDAGVSHLPVGANPSVANPNIATPAGWKQIGPQLGTEKGGTYELNGQKFYVKQPDDVARAHNEVLALNLYSAAGASAVKGSMVLVDGKPAVATEWMNNSEKVDWKSPGAKASAAEDYAVHVWLNNRDAIGAGHENPEDNIRLNKDTGKLTVLDAGGSLDYKGMGGSGKKPFTKDPIEWDTFRDPSVNPTMAKVFGGMTPQQLIDSTKKLKNVTDQHIEELVGKFGNTPKAQMIETLKARRDAILEIGKKLEDQIKAASVPVVPPTPISLVTNTPKPVAAIPPTIPPPPQLSATNKQGYHAKYIPVVQEKYDAIYTAAIAGDLAGIHAVKVDSSFGKKLVAYKNEAILAVEAGGKANPAHVVGIPPVAVPKPLSGKLPPKPGQSAISTPPVVVAPVVPVPPPKPVIDPSSFPSSPVFQSTNAANVQANNAKVQEALQHAASGDLMALQSMSLTGSPKLASWHADLASNLSIQLNPPPKPVPPVHLTDKYDQVTAHISSSLQNHVGKDKVGYWTALGHVPGVPSGIQPGTWHISGSPKLWDSGEAAADKSGAKQELRSYTGSTYLSMNTALREGNANNSNYKAALKGANALMSHGIEIQAGTMLSRKHSGISQSQWANVKPGTVIAEKGILSTSVDHQVWSGTTHLKMTIGPGVRGIPAKSFSQNSGEKEVLLPPNQRMLVTHTEYVKVDGQMTNVVHVIVLPTQDDQCCPP